MTVHEARRTSGVLVLSPHFDDIAFSVGGSLLSGRLGPEVTGVVVFTQSCWTRAGQGRAPVIETSVERLREEANAASAGGYRLIELGFAESILRPGIQTLADVFEPSDVRADAIYNPLETMLRCLIHAHEGPVLAPLGYGGHVDHRMVSAAFRDLWTESLPDAVVPMFYEDLPYSIDRSPELARSLLPPGRSLEAWISPVPQPNPKLELLALYPSQVDANALGHMERQWRTIGGEVLWVDARGREFLQAGLSGAASRARNS